MNICILCLFRHTAASEDKAVTRPFEDKTVTRPFASRPAEPVTKDTRIASAVTHAKESEGFNDRHRNKQQGRNNKNLTITATTGKQAG